jgi:beta-lactamase class C
MRLVKSLLVCALCVCSAAGGCAMAGAYTVKDSDIEALLQQQVVPFALGKEHFGGLAAAVRVEGRTVFFNEGFAEMASRAPVTSDTLFNIGSIRKVLETIVLAQAVQKGELRLDDPVSRYVTELKHGGTIREVTLGQLASHTSGLLLPTDHPPWPEHGYTLAQFLAVLNAWTPSPDRRPGLKHTYSHAGYVLLQLALERRFGMPIGQLLEERVLAPLGLASTMLPNNPLDGEHEPLPGAVQGYDEDREPIGVPGNQQSYYEFPGTGQMFSSARDLAMLVAANLGDVPVEPSLRAAMKLTQQPAFRIGPDIDQALAWEINRFTGPTIIDKPGGIDNASAYIGFVPKARVGLVLLVNRGGRNLHEIARETILPALARMVVHASH